MLNPGRRVCGHLGHRTRFAICYLQSATAPYIRNAIFPIYCGLLLDSMSAFAWILKSRRNSPQWPPHSRLVEMELYPLRYLWGLLYWVALLSPYRRSQTSSARSRCRCGPCDESSPYSDNATARTVSPGIIVEGRHHRAVQHMRRPVVVCSAQAVREPMPRKATFKTPAFRFMSGAESTVSSDDVFTLWQKRKQFYS